ncbi:cell division ATP-binding protein FtsE [Thiolinea disciformis]|uniref:cell division ATP-binding protein FtsE n=1 Tax=Thiolinea disciformis TaxID=125614 RepID=UPI0003807001|nr:cell division ATP-binding protein FtsE [Thiolinea disciformis]
MIEFKGVSKRYSTGQLALYNVNLSLAAGEMIFITGHSGSGKSTLLKLVALLERPSKGEVIVGGRPLNKLSQRNIPHYRRRIGFIFQDPHLLHDRTVFDNVAMPLLLSGLAQADIRRRVQAALDKVGLANKEKNYPLMLSAGEKQRVGIARAMVNRPTIILADEPTGNLDPELAQDIMYTFEQFNELGATVLIASHDHALVERMRKRTIVLQKVNP